MKVNVFARSAVIILIGVTGASQTIPEWKLFTSNTGFSVMYPGSWFDVGGSGDRLDILSSPERTSGVVILEGQAEIIVLEDKKDGSLSQFIDEYNRSATVLSRKHIANSRAASCASFEEVVARIEVGAERYIISTGYFCALNRRKFVTLVNNWEGDPQQASWQAVAVTVAKSLRLPEEFP